MNAILGFAGIIEKNPEDAETVKNAVAKIHASGDILMKIINDVLDLSKLESGKAELRETVVCLPELIEKLSHMLEYSMEQKRLRFRHMRLKHLSGSGHRRKARYRVLDWDLRL